MKYMQMMATIACGILLFISWQLHGMRPVKSGEIQSLVAVKNYEAAKKLRQNLPIVEVFSNNKAVEVYGSVRIDGEVSVGNQVSVTTGYITPSEKYENEPLKVEMVR